MSTIKSEEYAILKEAGIAATGEAPLVLPNGAIDRLYDDLTCKRCGRFACYKHIVGVKPLRGQEGLCIPYPDGKSWSRPINPNFLERYEDGLTVTP